VADVEPNPGLVGDLLGACPQVGRLAYHLGDVPEPGAPVPPLARGRPPVWPPSARPARNPAARTVSDGVVLRPDRNRRPTRSNTTT
jgi:hypothetical protein